jgi:hypothetical protein
LLAPTRETNVLPQEHPPTQKPIPTKVHGVLDYMTAAFLHTLPRVMGWSDNVTRVLDVAGGGATGYSLFTDNELGLVKALPMKAHLTLDAVSGRALVGAALVMDDEDPEVRATLAGIGAWEIAAALLTRRRPGRPRGPTRSSVHPAPAMSKAVHGPSRACRRRPPASPWVPAWARA